jgi:hypothetical protein
MRIPKTVSLCFILCAICLAATPDSESDDATRIIQTALQPSPIENNLRQLTDEIGGRVPGTPAMQRAIEWGTQMFKAAGADSVHTEDFEISNSWAEGATEMTVSASGTALDPGSKQTPKIEFRVRCVSIAWAPALAPVKHVPVVDVGEGTPDDFKKAGDISGKILLVCGLYGYARARHPLSAYQLLRRRNRPHSSGSAGA